jgi:hypothetical protein
LTDEFIYSSTLAQSRRDELADLMFHNVEQHRFRDDIVNAIDLYGVPEIVVENGSLRFSVEKLGVVQALFALDGDLLTGALVGVVLYARVSEEKIVLLHVGVDANYTSKSSASQRFLVMRLITRLRRIAAQIKGVNCVEVLYGRQTVMRL